MTHLMDERRRQQLRDIGTDPDEVIAEKTFGSLTADRFLMEYDSDRAGGFEALRFIPKGKTVVLGLITTKQPELESEELHCRRIDETTKYVPLENLALSTQCGFASTLLGNLISWDNMRRKLELVRRSRGKCGFNNGCSSRSSSSKVQEFNLSGSIPRSLLR